MADIRERRACISAFIHVISTSYVSTPASVSLQRMQGLTMRFKSTAEAPCKQELYALIDTLEWAMMLIEKQLQIEEDRHQGRVAELEADKCEWEQVATALMEELAVLQSEVKSLREHGTPCFDGCPMIMSSSGCHTAAQDKVHSDQAEIRPAISAKTHDAQTKEEESEYRNVSGLQAHSGDSTPRQEHAQEHAEARNQVVHWGVNACWDHTVAAAQAACEDAKVSMWSVTVYVTVSVSVTVLCDCECECECDCESVCECECGCKCECECDCECDCGCACDFGYSQDSHVLVDDVHN